MKFIETDFTIISTRWLRIMWFGPPGVKHWRKLIWQHDDPDNPHHNILWIGRLWIEWNRKGFRRCRS